MKNTKIVLLAEDNENDVKLTELAFKKNNINICLEVVKDGKEMIDYLFKRGKFKELESRRPDYILLDNNMPRLTGVEALEIVKRDKKLKNIPIVMLSTSGNDTEIAKTYEKGANAYIKKPYDFNDFLKKIKIIDEFWSNCEGLRR